MQPEELREEGEDRRRFYDTTSGSSRRFAIGWRRALRKSERLFAYTDRSYRGRGHTPAADGTTAGREKPGASASAASAAVNRLK